MSTRNKAMLSMVLLIVIICGIFLFTIYRQGEQNMIRLINSRATAASQVSELTVLQTGNQYQRRIKSFLNYQVSPTRALILKAFAERDREKLLSLSRPFLKILKKENQYFKSLAWITPNNETFLRVHHPDEKPKDISKVRPDLVAVNNEKVQNSGFTISKRKHQYRVVQPVFYQGEYIGALQMGIDADFLIEILQENLSLFAVIATENSEYDYWDKDKSVTLETSTHTVFSSNQKMLSRVIDKVDWSYSHHDLSDGHNQINVDDRTYVFHRIFEIKDFRGTTFSTLSVAIDITEAVAATQNLMSFTCFLSLVMLVFVALIFYYGFGGLLEQVWRLNRSLEQANLELEERVEERTKELSAEIEERKIAEEKLIRAEKMEAVGLMASGVAHDLNNILSGVVSYPELLLMRLPEDSKLRGPITSIKDSGLRAAAVVADLLTVARGAAKVRIVSNMNSLILEYLQFPEVLSLQQENSNVKLVTSLAADLPPVLCSPTHVNKCLMNLVTNAIESVDGAGEVEISSQLQVLPNTFFPETDLPAGDYIVVTVKDTGSGISKEDLTHIFEPFYTKKKMGRSGTGIGLAVVWNSMVDHDGTVLVSSNPEDGTTFTLLFPVCHSGEGAETEITKIASSNHKGAGETILVVDDEEQLRDIAVKVLTELDYQVQAVASGEAAITYVKEHPVDLLLLDMVMDPGLDGDETFAQIVAIRPEQKAVIVSGYASSAQVTSTLELGAASLLKKPYTVEQLGTAVSAALLSK